MKGPNQTPEELRAEYRARNQQLGERADRKQARMCKKWIILGIGFGIGSAVINYLSLPWICLLHGAVGGVIAYGLLRFERGHLTATVVFGLSNEIISAVSGHFNPFGVLAFCCAGAVLGTGIRLDRDL